MSGDIDHPHSGQTGKRTEVQGEGSGDSLLDGIGSLGLSSSHLLSGELGRLDWTLALPVSMLENYLGRHYNKGIRTSSEHIERLLCIVEGGGGLV